ncbi:MAG: Nramp family divalent metal transporter [Planctomycetes bacterium]|nr:Nramp family divalent metal transporter [Planctomycetota bacterium]
MARRRLEPSLGEVHASVRVSPTTGFWRRLLTFSGPAFMVSVGYMDPGNWATDLGAGSQFGYQLIWVILLSNLMAIILQTLSARLGIVSRRDLAQACRDHYPPAVTAVLWIVCEIAIAACDLAEVLGSAIALHLLVGIPLLWGVLATAFDVLLLLALQSYGIRRMEAVILSLVGTIGVCFMVEMFLSRPPLVPLLQGFVPGYLSGSRLYLAIGILGATVMPHNLYLHSALVQSRAVERSKQGLGEAAGFNLVDSIVALNAAFFVNAAILVLAAATFYRTGHHKVASLEEAHALLAPLLGTTLAPILFAVALLAAGQSSTITGTMAGQIVMEGFVSLRMKPWLRRLVTRLLAITPAVVVILVRGSRAVDDLLILSQVILSLQLSFAVVPLTHFTSDRRRMGSFATPWWGQILAWSCTAIIVSLNVKLVFETIVDGVRHNHWAAQYLLLPAAAILGPLLVWMILEPFWRRLKEQQRRVVPTPVLPALESSLPQKYRRIAIALEAAPSDGQILASVIPLIRASEAEVVLIHVVESATARFIGEIADDSETRHDAEYLDRVADQLRSAGMPCKPRLGAGEPCEEIARLAEEEHADLIVTGAHGHKLLGDLFHGSTVDELRHLTGIPLLTIRTAPTSQGEKALTRAALRY